MRVSTGIPDCLRILLPLLAVCMAASALAQDASVERQLVIDAANAMGGVDRLAAVRTLRLRGYGQEAYQDGGSKVTTEASAPEKMTNLAAYERVIDLANDRTRVEARIYRSFIFAGEAMMAGRPINQVLDGDVAYDVGPDGNARRQSDETAMRRRTPRKALPVARPTAE